MAPVQSPSVQSQGSSPVFRFLDLLPELRNSVYESVFADIQDKASLPLIRPRQSLIKQMKTKLTLNDQGSSLSLLPVNRQCHAVASGYVYPELEATFFEIPSSDWANPELLAPAIARDRVPLNIDRLSSLLTASPRLQCISRLSVQGLDNLFMLTCPKHLSIGRGLEEVQRRLNIPTASLQRDLNEAKVALFRVGSMLPNLTRLHVEDHSLEEMGDFRKVEDDFQLCWIQILFAGRMRHFAHLRLTFPNLTALELKGASRTESYQYSESRSGWNRWPEDTPVKWIGPDSREDQSDAYGEILPVQRHRNMIVPLLWMSFL